MSGERKKTSHRSHLGGGNTKPPPKERRARRYCITLNNYTVEESDLISQAFKLHAKNYIIGKEIGEEKGTPHLQIFVEYTNQRTFSVVKAMVGDRAHIETAKGTLQQNWKYCTKDGDFETNMDESQFSPATKKLSAVERAKIEVMEDYEGVEWKGWQKKIIDILKTPCPKFDRKIHWFWEPDGNMGKSFLMKYLVCVNTGVVIGEGAMDNVMNQVNTLMQPKKGEGQIPRIVTIDCPRSSIKYVNYALLEKLKGGLIYSGKYEGGVCIFRAPHIIVMANSPPKKGEMSHDRWVITKITKEVEDTESDEEWSSDSGDES